MRHKKPKYGEIGEIVLKSLVAVPVAVAILALPGLASVLVLFTPRNTQHRYRIKQSTIRLKNKGLVTTSLRGGVFYAKLTTKGRKEAKLLQIQEKGLAIKKKWNGKWYLVLFDIPEKHRGARVALTRTLNRIGLFPLQKSVFAYPYDCGKEISFITDYFGVENYVMYAIVEQIDNDTKLRHFFKL